MTTGGGAWVGRAARRAPDVVAALTNDPGTPAVARAAVREAARRGVRVRFLQAHRPATPDEDRARNEEAIFEAALRALREAPRVAVTFEVAEGEPGEVFVARSHDAGSLVVGDDRAEGTPGAPGNGLAAYCAEHAQCPVLLVPTRARLAHT